MSFAISLWNEDGLTFLFYSLMDLLVCLIAFVLTRVFCFVLFFPGDGREKVFGKEASDDITGIQVWAASLIAARWVVDLAGELKDKSVIELGCGCGLPGLAALAYTQAKEVVLTDYFQHAIDNLKHNISINADVPNINDRSSVHAVDWTNPSTWIKDEKGEVKKFDVILGCDLVYEIDLVVPLAAIVLSILKDDGTFYYVSGGKRQGAKEFITALRDQGLECDLVPLADQYKDNPLVSSTIKQIQTNTNKQKENKMSHLLCTFVAIAALYSKR
eukprot:m.100083 g.100083  ORF g.100083 m.100083 type:complete len:273 (-) comp12547_c0_seq22:1948-2766(-)